MANQNLEKYKENDKNPTPSSSGGSPNPISGRLEAHNRGQQEKSKQLGRVFDILERAKNNLRVMEEHRLSQMEGLKNLRARLFQENQDLRLMLPPSSSISAPILSLPGSSNKAAVTGNLLTATASSTSSFPRRKMSSKSVTIAQIPSQSRSLITSQPATPKASSSTIVRTPSRSRSLITSLPPSRTSSSRSLQSKKSQRIYKRSKHRMLPGNEDNVSAFSGESEKSATAKDLKQRLLSNFK
ncbi:uncharacterized protein [Drosophila kikkawai]|uniref:Uncharacterized protein n=1 Tax=Drosophila kikkawai TaxID=30033 RepID=A0A6P4INU9_DROKI|nr:uncharacterized protein LOC108076024 [Drosophila kikkawai]